MRVVCTDADVATVEADFDGDVADALRSDVEELEEQLASVERKAGVRRRMNTVWRNFIGERYLEPGSRLFRALYIITGYGVVFYDVIKKKKYKQKAAFRSLENNREQVVKDAELKIAKHADVSDISNDDTQ